MKRVIYTLLVVLVGGLALFVLKTAFGYEGSPWYPILVGLVSWCARGTWDHVWEDWGQK